MMSNINIDDPQITKLVKEYEEMAKKISNHPSVIGFSIGGEINSHPVNDI